MSSWNADALNKMIIMCRHGRDVFDVAEFERVYAQLRRNYYSQLADAVLQGTTAQFWQFHREGLATAGLKLERAYLTIQVLRLIAELVACPKTLVGRIVRFWTTSRSRLN
jgi:hypothetical protein